MSSKKFFKFAAYLQIIGIILVVLGHSFHEYPDGAHGGKFILNAMLHSFRMPLFMFVSGFLMEFTTSISKKTWRSFVSDKVKRLIIPFLTLSLITFYPRCMMTGFSDDSIAPTASNLIKSFIYSDFLTIPFFWFIHASFILLITVYGLILLSRRFKIPAKILYPSLMTICMGLIYMDLAVPNEFSINFALSLSIYFIAGCAYSHWMKRIDRIIPWNSWLTATACFILWLATFFAIEHCQHFIFACSFFGIMMMISLAKILEYRHISVLDHLIGSNYLIFLLSWYFNVLTQQVLSKFVILPWWVHSILSLSFGIYIPWLIFKWMQRNQANKSVRTMAFLLGQKLKK